MSYGNPFANQAYPSNSSGGDDDSGSNMPDKKVPFWHRTLECIGTWMAALVIMFLMVLGIDDDFIDNFKTNAIALLVVVGILIVISAIIYLFVHFFCR